MPVRWLKKHASTSYAGARVRWIFCAACFSTPLLISTKLWLGVQFHACAPHRDFLHGIQFDACIPRSDQTRRHLGYAGARGLLGSERLPPYVLLYTWTPPTSITVPLVSSLFSPLTSGPTALGLPARGWRTAPATVTLSGKTECVRETGVRDGLGDEVDAVFVQFLTNRRCF